MRQAHAGIGMGLLGGGSSSSSGGLFTSLFSGLGSFFGGFRAEGGPVIAGRSYIVGERQAELFTPNVSGMIHPNITPVSQAMGGSTSTPAGGSTAKSRGQAQGDQAQVTNHYTVTMHVQAADAQSFKRSQTSIMAAMSAGLNRASMRSR